MTTEQIEIIRSDRKSISLEIKPDMRVIVRAPKKTSEKDIERFIEEKTEWLEKHLNIMKQRILKEAQNKFTQEEISNLTAEAKKVISERAAYYAPLIGVTYGRITIRHQLSRWGSCSSKGNLNFNCILMLCPPEVTDYVVVHELCHRKEMNHSARFWAEVARIIPDYKERRKWLKDNGNELIRRLG